MENAAEALKMAAWVLIFVLALSVTMNAFSQARQSIDQIILDSDREYVTEYVEESPSTHRIVGAESVLPTIYRAYKENIKIKFENSDYIYQKRNPVNNSLEDINNSLEDIYTIDLTDESYSDENMRLYILKRILFGSKVIVDETLEGKISGELKFRDDGFYDVIKGNTYEEFIGVYAQGEENGVIAGTESSHNKTEKKVITFVKK